ncbi:hypothetical protein IKQ21_02700, partial [bacterium]|nr:hypothetical protein [bacterium]
MNTNNCGIEPNKDSKREDFISVVFSCDDNYFQHLYCAIVSMIYNKNASDRISIYVLIEKLCDKNVKLLEKLCDSNDIALSFVKVSGEDFRACPIT